MANNIERLADHDLKKLVGVMYSAILGNEGSYGLSPGDSAELLTRLDNFTALLNDAAIAKVAAMAATTAKNNGRANLVDEVTVLARRIYADPSVSNALLAEAGLSPRNHSKPRIVPKETTNLVASPFADGRVRLQWNKNGNKYGVTYLVETSGDGHNWRLITVTTKTQIILQGFEPGQTAWFRILATRNEKTSLPSSVATIYSKHGGQRMNTAA